MISRKFKKDLLERITHVQAMAVVDESYFYVHYQMSRHEFLKIQLDKIYACVFNEKTK